MVTGNDEHTPHRTQLVAISHHHTGDGGEALCYAPAPVEGDNRASEIHTVPVSRREITQGLEAIRERIDAITMCATLGKPREGLAIEQCADHLAQRVLPRCGLSGLLCGEALPQLDIIQDAASEIPWELFREPTMHCPRCETGTELVWDNTSNNYCRKCGTELRRHREQLALTRHVSHLIRGAGAAVQGGSRFLMVVDPLGDLCSDEKDPDGRCAAHLVEVQGLLEQRGFVIDMLRGKNATCGRLASAMSDPEIGGIYYFGHGYTPPDHGDGQLVLADGGFSATEVAETPCAAGFVFLNACHGAKAGRNWGIEDRSRAVGAAFACGDTRKVVIAPIWPVVNVHAAEMALHFFRNVDSSSCGSALQRARHASFQRYENGEPDLGWSAYRYFGSPLRELPSNRSAPIDRVAAGNLVSAEGEIAIEGFAFDWDRVMVAAVKRRVRHERPNVSRLDVLAGVIRSGALTRHYLRALDQDPDRLYERLSEFVSDPERQLHGACPDATASGESLTEEEYRAAILKTYRIRDRDQLSSAAAEVLEHSLAVAPQGRASEDHLLQSLLMAETWNELADLDFPSLAALQDIRRDREKNAVVDENGALLFGYLHPDARLVVDVAHRLAQQRGTFPISHRLFLAAFLAIEDGSAAHLVSEAGHSPDELFQLMISSSEKKYPRSFVLDEEACGRIVVPALRKARDIATDSDSVSGEEIFRGFCRLANASFKDSLRDHDVGLDLDLWSFRLPDAGGKIDARVREILLEALDLARAQGHADVRSPHLFAAMIGEGENVTHDLLTEIRADSATVRRAAISIVIPAGAPLDESADMAWSPHVVQILNLGQHVAAAREGTELRESDLLHALLLDGGGVVGRMMLELGHPLPRFATAQKKTERNGTSPDGNEPPPISSSDHGSD